MQSQWRALDCFPGGRGFQIMMGIIEVFEFFSWEPIWRSTTSSDRCAHMKGSLNTQN